MQNIHEIMELDTIITRFNFSFLLEVNEIHQKVFSHSKSTVNGEKIP